MPKCLFCCKDKPVLTNEHIIPAALGSDLLLPKSTCEECLMKCNKSFEHRFLKGSNFVALLRASIGIRGRRNEPIYGFDQHGDPLTVTVQPGFPAIRVGLSSRGIERPMQVILSGPNEPQQPLSYYFLPDPIERPITQNLFDDIVDTVPRDAMYAAFWADGDVLPVNYWRELSESFVTWCNSHGLTAMTSVVAAGNAQVNLSIDWNLEYRNRGLAKICFMYAMSITEEDKRYSSAFDRSRSYILDGELYPSVHQPYCPVLQWNGLHPGHEILAGKQFTYLLATVNTDEGLYSLVQLHNMGLFAVRLTAAKEEACPDMLHTYFLEKDDGGRYSLIPQSFSPDEVEGFAEAAQESKQLTSSLF